MQIIAKKGVKIYRDFYIDMDIKPALTPKTVKLPLDKAGQHIDFKKTIGDSLLKYDVIAYIKNNIPVYSPVNGILKDITVGPQMGDVSGMQYAIIEADDSNTPTYPLWKTEAEYSKQDLLEIIKNAAIINESAEAFLINTINKATKYQKIIIDAVDEQPFDLSRTAVLKNYQNEVIGGAKILAKAFGINQMEVLLIKNFCTQSIFKNGIDGAKIVKVGGKYPLFTEILQYAHSSTGLLVGAQCCRAIYRATYFGEPQISNVVTVWGEGVDEPQNTEVIIGTPIKEIMEKSKARGILERVVAGGVMKGYVASPEWPLFGYNGVLTVMPLKKHSKTIECINCGRCAKVCPMKLAPNYILRSSHIPGENIAKQLSAGMCIFCGACSYICPSRLPLMAKIREYNTALVEGKLI